MSLPHGQTTRQATFLWTAQLPERLSKDGGGKGSEQLLPRKNEDYCPCGFMEKERDLVGVVVWERQRGEIQGIRDRGMQT